MPSPPPSSQFLFMSVRFVPERIISGGQTGVDRGALDAAITLGIDHGGWCPAGRLAEDGSVPPIYRLEELTSPSYPERTEKNVIESDATLILYRKKMSGGTSLTQRICRRESKPYLSVPIDPKTESLGRIAAWLLNVRPKVLNVAGPRESNASGIHAQTLALMTAVLG